MLIIDNCTVNYIIHEAVSIIFYNIWINIPILNSNEFSVTVNSNECKVKEKETENITLHI